MEVALDRSGKMHTLLNTASSCHARYTRHMKRMEKKKRKLKVSFWHAKLSFTFDYWATTRSRTCSVSPHTL